MTYPSYSSVAEIKDQDVVFAMSFLIEILGDSGGDRLVDDTKDIEASGEARDEFSILSGLML